MNTSDTNTTGRAPVAILDDDELACRAIRRLLGSRGLHAVTFTESVKFIDLLDAQPWFRPACVILDMDMPGINGLEVQKRLAACRRSVPVIVLSGRTDTCECRQALKAGAVAVFSKPLYEDEEMFIATVEAMVGT